MSALVQPFGDVLGGIAQGNAYHYQAAVAANNAKVAAQNASYSAAAGAVNTEKAGLKASSELSGMRAAMGANGLDVNSGSAADVQTSQRLIGAEDQGLTANRAALNVYGYQTQEMNYNAQENLDQTEASDAPIAGALNAAGSLISNDPDLPTGYEWMGSGGGGSGGGGSGGGG